MKGRASVGPRSRGFKPAPGDKRQRAADVMLRFSEPNDIQRDTGSNEKRKELEGKGAGDDRGLSSVQELLTGQWKGKKGNSSL